MNAPVDRSAPTGVLLVSCLDRRGIVAAVAAFVTAQGGNVVDLQQHTDPVDGVFFQRVEFELDGLTSNRSELAAAFAPVGEQFGMEWQLRFSDDRPRVALLASKEPHCLVDQLNRWRSGEMPCDVAVVISNHPDHAETAAWFGVEYVYAPVTAATKRDQEQQIDEVLRRHHVDLVVLARYMQVLSAEFCAAWPMRIINIHHSFLPAFMGAKPYHQAHDRGVKLIGVTAHYATADLDDGPIIDQDVIRVSHRDDVEHLKRKGRDLEVAVLARAVRAHAEHRVHIHARRTIVFL